MLNARPVSVGASESLSSRNWILLATPNIPPKSNRRWKPYFSKRLDRERNVIERFFSKLKHFRRVATRYYNLAANFLAMVQLALMRLWLRAYKSTA